MTTREIFELTFAILNLLAIISIGFFTFRLSKVYSKKSDSHNNDILFHQLFRDFNSRYSKVNFSLQDLLERCNDENYTLSDLKADRKLHDQIMDYFNICCEEYYWKKKDRIPNDVWNAWLIGMNYWYQNTPVLRELWKEEIAGNGYKSYYLKRGDNLFKENSES